MKGKLLKALEEMRKASAERKFTQAVDLIISLKNYDLKKDGAIEEFIRLPKVVHKAKVCAIVGREMRDLAKEADRVLVQDEWAKLTQPKDIKKIVREYDFFIAQATLMTEIAQKFGRYLAGKGKMPNPKAGQVVPPTVSLAPIVQKLRETVRIRAIKAPVAFAKIGDEKMSNEDLAENAAFILEQLINKLPQGKNNISRVMLKTSMGKPVKVEL